MATTKKKPTGDSDPAGCVGTTCDWLFHGKGGFSCNEGYGDCIPAEFLLADPSAFHDALLEEASIKMNRILHRIPANLQGKKLAFATMSNGVLLAWVDHNAPPPGSKTVSRKSDEKTIKKALKLKAATSKPGKKR